MSMAGIGGMEMRKLSFLIGLGEGAHRMICPECSGGTSKEKSLLVAIHPMMTKWICFRDSCGFKGRVTGHGPILPKDNKVVKANDSDISGYTRYPINDGSGKCRGWIHRNNDKGMLPKVVNNIDSDWCGLHFPRQLTTTHCMLVEDRASAEAMSIYFPTVALLGTYLSKDKTDILIKSGIKYGIIALDADATVSALNLKAKNSFIVGMIQLDKDLKDCTPKELYIKAKEANKILTSQRYR